MRSKPIVLVILDGWGLREEEHGNAIRQAKTPNFSKYLDQYLHTSLQASGPAVGLPVGQMGNSEVGHLTLGTGRLIEQDLTRIQSSIQAGEFARNEVFQNALQRTKEAGKSLHLCGLLSDGGVHSHIDHLFQLLEMAAKQGLKEVWLHIFLDGRDVSPASAMKYLQDLAKVCQSCGVGKIATLMGRLYAMDRDHRWERIQAAYQAMVYGKGKEEIPFGDPPWDSLASFLSSQLPVTDEFIPPVVVNSSPSARISEEDTVLFYNFRPDRMRQLGTALLAEDFSAFDRGPKAPQSLYSVSMTSYGVPDIQHVAFPPIQWKNTLGEVLSRARFRQLRVAETEKYPHVTWFFNGGREEPFPGEERILVPSPKVPTYDLCPEMSALEITKKLQSRLSHGDFECAIINYANPDMVGHSGKLQPTMVAVETVDACLGKVVEKVLQQDGVVLVTADHGNAEQMIKGENQPHTAHTTSLVPFIFVGRDFYKKESCSDIVVRLPGEGSLCDVAATILSLSQLPIPSEMTGTPLFHFKQNH